VDTSDEEELVELTRKYLEDRYAPVVDAIENGEWLRIDRIGMRLLGKKALTSAEWLYLKLSLAGGANREARYVMIDEVQDYTEAQLMVLAKYFPNAHFLLLGDENQAIREGTANFERVKSVFEKAKGTVDECSLMTSYRSSPEITSLFTRLLPDAQRVQAQSVQRPGTEPNVCIEKSRKALDKRVADLVEGAAGSEGLTAVIAPNSQRMKQLAKVLGDAVIHAGKASALPQSGVLLLDVKLAKGLEFDRVIVTDVDDEYYPQSDVMRHRLYTAISRATQEVSLVAAGKLAELLA
jgi:DNA helicase-2/ATP-dependent DNA helicase PcrA